MYKHVEDKCQFIMLSLSNVKFFWFTRTTALNKAIALAKKNGTGLHIARNLRFKLIKNYYILHIFLLDRKK